MMFVGLAMDAARALLMMTVMCLAPLSGCFGEDAVSEDLSGDDLKVFPSILPAGEWVTITISANSDMSVFSLISCKTLAQ